MTLSRSVALLAGLLVAGCATFGSERADQPQAVRARAGLPVEARLDLGLLVFDPGLPPEGEELPDDLHPGIRSAEAHYLPCLLRHTLQRTQQWGDVFLGYRESGAVDVIVRATIVESDGERLVLDVQVVDATQRVWIDERYYTDTHDTYYAKGEEDPYQPMFNTIANDLVQARERLTPDEMVEVRRVAELLFAADFSPEGFSDYVEPGQDGRLELVRLPASGDPMYDRVMQARSRELMFMDSLNGHYEGLCGDLTDSYLQWRDASRAETVLYREARNKKIVAYAAIPVTIALVIVASAATQDPTLANSILIAGTYGVAKIYSTAQEYSAEAELHGGTLEEMNASFDLEAAPMVVETEGETRKLEGSVDEQYEEWRRLLHELYEAESGMLATVETHLEPAHEDARPLPRPLDEASTNGTLPDVTSPPPDESR